MSGTFRVGEWLVDFDLGQIATEHKATHIKPMAMRLLSHLIENASKVISKKRLIESVWRGAHVSDDVLTHSISELRKAFDDDARSARIIETIPKRGYRLIAPVVMEERFQGAATGPPRLAVLPFENLSGDPGQQPFVSAITDLLITHLARSGLFRVISRTSVLGYEQQGKLLSMIARDLRVDRLVEGTVVCSRERVRVTVRLLSALDENLWAEIYEEKLTDVLAVQRQLACAIVREITKNQDEHSRWLGIRAGRVGGATGPALRHPG